MSASLNFEPTCIIAFAEAPKVATRLHFVLKDLISICAARLRQLTPGAQVPLRKSAAKGTEARESALWRLLFRSDRGERSSLREQRLDTLSRSDERDGGYLNNSSRITSRAGLASSEAYNSATSFAVTRLQEFYKV
eukprot:6194594-Pleurochrysis_carterae.AAC.2